MRSGVAVDRQIGFRMVALVSRNDTNIPLWTHISFVCRYSVTDLYILTDQQHSWRSSNNPHPTPREKYSNVLQTHIVIVGQVRILVLLFRYSQTICRWLGDAISKLQYFSLRVYMPILLLHTQHLREHFIRSLS